MTYEMYQTIFWHAGVLTIIFAVGDVLLFVILKIPKVIGQLSGRTARKGIADIWKKNIQTRGRCYKSCAENHCRRYDRIRKYTPVWRSCEYRRYNTENCDIGNRGKAENFRDNVSSNTEICRNNGAE